jgi:hypothetical protein
MSDSEKEEKRYPATYGKGTVTAVVCMRCAFVKSPPPEPTTQGIFIHMHDPTYGEGWYCQHCFQHITGLGGDPENP